MTRALCVVPLLAVAACFAQSTDPFRELEMMQRSLDQEQATARRAAYPPSSGATVSVRQLEHHYKVNAIKRFNKAIRLAQAGDHVGAIDLLQSAIKIDPQFLEAHNNLALEFNATNQTDRAIQEIGRMFQIDPDSLLAYNNLGAIYCNHGRYADAEAVARAALRMDPTNSKANRILLICQRHLATPPVQTASR